MAMLGGVGLPLLAIALFLVKVEYLGEGYGGPDIWPDLVLALGWLSFLLGLALLLAAVWRLAWKRSRV